MIDTDSCGLDLCYRAAEAGHEIRWFMPKEKGVQPMDGDGFPKIQKVNEWKSYMSWAKSGLIVNLYNDKNIVKELDRYRDFGFPVFGPTAKSAELEINRGKGMKVFEDHGVEVPPYKTFQTLDDCIAHAKKSDQAYVFKTLGDEEDKSLSFVASDQEEMVNWLEDKKAKGLKLKGPCMLQEKVELIAEVGVSGWMGKDGFLPNKWNINFEHKKLMPGDFGPNTGEMGTVCKYVKESKLADYALKPFEEVLKKLGHIGDVDVNCGIDEKGKAWPFEWTSRFGWPSTQILFASHKGDPIEWMKDALKGKDSLEVDERTAVGVGMFACPFPYPDEEQESQGLRVTGIEDVWEKVSPWQLMLDGEEYKTTGPYVCVVTAHGPDLHDAIPSVYEAVDRIKFPNRIVRNDIGQSLEKKLPALHALGYEEIQW